MVFTKLLSTLLLNVKYLRVRLVRRIRDRIGDEKQGAFGTKTRVEMAEGWNDATIGVENRLISQGLAPRRTDKLKMGFKEPQRINLIFLLNQQLPFIS
jgi:hypothetical protein